MDIIYTLTSPQSFTVLLLLLLGAGAITLAGLGGWGDRDFDKGTKLFLKIFGAIFLCIGLIGILLILYPFLSPSLRMVQKDFSNPSITPTPIPQTIPKSPSLAQRLIPAFKWVIIAAVFMLIIWGYTSLRKYLHKHPITRNRINEIRLSYLPSPNNEIHLNIHNNEKSYVVINKMHIGHKNNLQKDQEPPWSRVSRHAGVRVESGKSQTARFIVEDPESKVFSIVSYTDIGENTNTAIYGLGIHKFDVKIEYDSSEKALHGTLKWFNVTVNYKSPKDFDISIKDINR